MESLSFKFAHFCIFKYFIAKTKRMTERTCVIFCELWISELRQVILLLPWCRLWKYIIRERGLSSLASCMITNIYVECSRWVSHGRNKASVINQQKGKHLCLSTMKIVCANVPDKTSVATDKPTSFTQKKGMKANKNTKWSHVRFCLGMMPHWRYLIFVFWWLLEQVFLQKKTKTWKIKSW